MPEAAFLDPTAPGFSIRSDEVLEARALNWYAHTPYGLAILRYEAVQDLLLHPTLRQGSYRWPDHNDCHGIWARWWKRIMLNREGEDHARLRRLGLPAFAPKLVHAWRPAFERLSCELVQHFVDRGSCEFMVDFAEPYASRVICLMIGLPETESARLTRLAAEMGLALGVHYKRDEARADAAIEAMFDYSRALVQQKRQASTDDFITRLIHVTDQTERLSDQELHDLIVLSIFGGMDTTRNQLGLAMDMFIQHPAQWRLLSERPELARAAVEEVMRTRPTITWVTREATETFDYRCLTIEKGTTLQMFSAVAATDPDVFTPGFDISVKRKPHFGFGAGRHHCIGSPIARSDMEIALTTLSRHLGDVTYAEAPVWLPDSGNTGPVTLPIRFNRRQH